MEGSGPDGLFTGADRRGTIPANTTLALLTLAVASLVLWTGWTGQLRIALTVMALLFVGAVAARQLAPRSVAADAEVTEGRLPEDPAPDDASDANRPYVLMRAVYTRRAFGVDQLRPVGDDVRPIALPDLADAISAWDPGALTRAAARLAAGVPHRVGWTADNAQLDAVIPVAPSGSGDVRSWSALHIAAPLADAQGDPLMRLDPVTGGGDALAPVRIVGGAEGYALVPSAPDAIAGPSLDSRRSRLALAWSAQNYALLSQPAGTRILRELDPRELVRRMAPFFQQGTTLFPIVDRDTLYWVVELYATSTHYPITERLHLGTRGVRYAHHAATAIVNGSSGHVRLVLTDEPEPLTRSWLRLTPTMFETWAEVRPSMADKLPPAIDGARLQAQALASAGTRSSPAPGGNLPPEEGAATELLAGDPTLHGILVEDGTRPATAWSMPVLDREQRLRGAVVAVGGRVHAARSLDLQPGERWPVIRESLRRALDTVAIAPRDARVLHGPVHAAPLPSGLALTQSAYVWRGDGPPSLLGTAVWTNEGPARAGTDIPTALGVPVEPIPRTGLPLHGESLEARVRTLYATMDAALRRGDLAAFAAAFDSLGRALGTRPR
jgi:hypothetical protein